MTGFAVNPLFAALPDLPASSGGQGLDGWKHIFSSTMITVLLVLAIGALCVVWAVFFRKPDRDPGRGALLDKSSSSSSGRRRRPRNDRRRNPTRAEVGGLPPMGAGDSSKPPL
jgi:hypothetical protein